MEAFGRGTYQLPSCYRVEDFGSSLGLTAQVVHPYEPTKICQYMEQALAQFSEALQQAPETPIQALGILPAEEYELVVHSWNSTERPTLVTDASTSCSRNRQNGPQMQLLFCTMTVP